MTIGQLEARINHARSTNQASGAELALHRQVAILAGIYGRMIYAGATDTAQIMLTDIEQAALE